MGTGALIIDSSICVATITGLPARRHSRTARRWMPGTFSAGNSTPKSPRATITASDLSTMASSASTADGFSSLVMMPARPRVSARASSRSSGRCTNESASHSTPSSSANSRSRRSFSVNADNGSTTSGTLTPFRSDNAPPTTTSVSA